MKAKPETEEIKHTAKIVVYGGNGFVGTHVARALLARDVCTVCLSRTGHKPLHLGDQQWSESVRWCKGDASQPDTQLLQRLDGLITLVGSPPLPTFSKQAYDEQVFANGTTNANAIKGAGEAGIKRVVLLGAQLPFFMRRESFGYAQGKKIAMQAAKDFSELSSEHRAIVIQPGMIYGRRYLKSGSLFHSIQFSNQYLGSCLGNLLALKKSPNVSLVKCFAMTRAEISLL